jgi:hypothetical protein
MSNPHEHLPDVASVTPVALAHEAVMHHAGANGLAAHAGPNARAFDTRDLHAAEQPTAAPWIAVEPPPGRASFAIKRRWPDGLDRTDRMHQTIARVILDDAGQLEVRTCGTMGKAEIEWANAALIARMREREPIIAAEFVRIAADLARLRSAIAAARATIAAIPPDERYPARHLLDRVLADLDGAEGK